MLIYYYKILNYKQKLLVIQNNLLNYQYKLHKLKMQILIHSNIHYRK